MNGSTCFLFITPTVAIVDGEVIPDGTPYVTIDANNDYTVMYDLMANIQQTLPSHVIVGIYGHVTMGFNRGRPIVMDHVHGLGRTWPINDYALTK